MSEGPEISFSRAYFGRAGCFTGVFPKSHSNPSLSPTSPPPLPAPSPVAPSPSHPLLPPLCRAAAAPIPSRAAAAPPPLPHRRCSYRLPRRRHSAPPHPASPNMTARSKKPAANAVTPWCVTRSNPNIVAADEPVSPTRAGVDAPVSPTRVGVDAPVSTTKAGAGATMPPTDTERDTHLDWTARPTTTEGDATTMSLPSSASHPR